MPAGRVPVLPCFLSRFHFVAPHKEVLRSSMLVKESLKLHSAEQRNQAGNRDRSGSLEEPLQRRELLLLSGGALHQQGNVFGGGLSSSAQELRAPAAPEVSARRLHGRGRRVPAAQEFSERTDGLDRTENVGAQALCAPHQRFLQTPHQDAPRIGDGRGCDGSGRRTAPRDRGESSASFVGGRSAGTRARRDGPRRGRISRDHSRISRQTPSHAL